MELYLHSPRCLRDLNCWDTTPNYQESYRSCRYCKNSRVFRLILNSHNICWWMFILNSTVHHYTLFYIMSLLFKAFGPANYNVPDSINIKYFWRALSPSYPASLHKWRLCLVWFQYCHLFRTNVLICVPFNFSSCFSRHTSSIKLACSRIRM